MTRLEFMKALANHDWYYMFSDDPGVYRRGAASYDQLRSAAKLLDCPWSLNKVRKLVLNMIESRFTQSSEDADVYYRKGDRYSIKYSREDLISVEEEKEMLQWFKA
jgi:hypothetical protein